MSPGRTFPRAMTVAKMEAGEVEQVKNAPGKTGRASVSRLAWTLLYIEYLNSGIAFSSSLVALYTA